MKLCEAIRRSVERDLHQRDEGRGDELMNLMKEIVGPIPRNSRDRLYVNARMIVAWQLRKEGYSLSYVGVAVKRDHSTVVHMTKKMQDIVEFPNAYADVIDIWKQFRNKMEYEIQ